MPVNKKKRSPSKRKPVRTSNQVGLPPETSLARWVLLAIVFGVLLIGLSAYLKWAGRRADVDRQTAQQPNQSAIQSEPVPDTSPAGNRAWTRECEVSCLVSQEDLADSWNKIDNAAEDGWSTEVFSDAATKQWKRLKQTLTQGPFEDSALEFLLDPAIRAQKLVPPNLETTFRDATFMVQRAKLDGSAPDETSMVPAAGALAASLRELIAPFSDPEKIRMKIKIYRVTKEPDVVKTLQTLEMFGPTATGVKEINAHWTAVWTSDVEHPTLKQLAVTEFETAEANGKTLFTECTESILGSNASFQTQLLKGYNHWLDRSQFHRYSDLLGSVGVAVGDINADGLEDLYVCQEAGLPNLLFLQREDGTLEDISERSGTNWLENSRSVLILDLNNDGHSDLAVAVDGGVIIAEGNDTGAFAVRRVLNTDDDIMSLTAADYDQDGRLDLYVGVYYKNEYGGEPESQQLQDPGFVYYDSRNGGANSLWRNQIAGDQWNFEDVTQAVGLNDDNWRFTLAASWDDVDNDGDQDLYIANDYATNNLFRNDRLPDGSRKFVDIARSAGAEDRASGMSVSWGDYNQDGWMDIYVGNMYSYAGNRIMFQDAFKSDADEPTKEMFRRMARGNTLLKNVASASPGGELKFEDRSIEAAVNRGRWAWGSTFVDINNDSWEDLVVANGYITTEDTGDL